MSLSSFSFSFLWLISGRRSGESAAHTKIAAIAADNWAYSAQIGEEKEEA